MFIQTLIDEEVVPLSGILKGFLLIRDVCKWSPWSNNELETMSNPTWFSYCPIIPLKKLKKNFDFWRQSMIVFTQIKDAIMSRIKF